MAVTIDGFEIHLAKAEQHSIENDITMYPVEKGATMSDHVIELPTMVTVECVQTDTPFDPSIPGQKPSDEAFAFLEGLNAAKKVVEITTSLKRWPSMMLKSINIPIDQETGDALRFTATFQQVEIVENEDAIVFVSIPSAAKKTTKGHKAPIFVPYLQTGVPGFKIKKIDPATYFGSGPGMKGVGRNGRIPIAIGGS